MPMFTANGVKLHYREFGKGMPLIFIHPPLLTGANFYYQQLRLSDQFRVIAPDMRGHGASSASDEPFTYARLVDDLKLLLDHLGIEQALIGGYSTGGTVALEALLACSDRFVGGIMISGMSEVSDWQTMLKIRLAVMFASQPQLASILFHGIVGGNSDSLYTYRLLYHESIHGDLAHIRQYFQCSLRVRVTDRLHHILQPMLLVCGERDRVFRRYARVMQTRLPHCRYRIIPRAGHQIPTRNAEDMHHLICRWAEREFPSLGVSYHHEPWLQGAAELRS